MHFPTKWLALLFLLVTSVAAQQIQMFSDNNCKKSVFKSKCDPHHSCFNLKKPVLSYKILVANDLCGGSLFLSWRLYHGKDSCYQGAQTGGGGVAGCEPHGCLKTMHSGYSWNGPKTANSAKCGQDFNEKARRNATLRAEARAEHRARLMKREQDKTVLEEADEE